MAVKAVKGIVTTTTKVTEEKKYKVINRSQTDRTLLIEHANRTNQQFKLVDTEKPMEETPEVYRFQTPLKAGETKTYTVKEERDISSSIQLTNNADEQIRYFINLTEASPALKTEAQGGALDQGRVGHGASRVAAGGGRSAAAERGPGSDPQEPA